MPNLNLTEALRMVQQNNKHNKDLQNLRIPSSLGKSVDMILGQKYWQIYPEVIHTLPNGLTIYKSKLQPWNPGETACIGGPIEALEGAMNVASTGTILRNMANLIHDVKEYRPKLEYFPDEIYVKREKVADRDIPDIEAYEKEQNEAFCSHFCSHAENVRDDIKLSKDPHSSKSETVYTIQSDLAKFMKMQEAGLDVGYHCVECRQCDQCKKGAERERLSIIQEKEQDLIRRSVHVD